MLEPTTTNQCYKYSDRFSNPNNMKAKISKLNVPADLREVFAATPKAHATWLDITPIMRRDWILWITSVKLPETRARRIKVACSKLASGKRRVCCFGGIKWLTKMNEAKRTVK